MQKFKVVDNGNPDGTAKNALAGISPGTNYKAEVWNDNLFNIFLFVENAGYTLIDDDTSQLIKASKGLYRSTFTYNTSAIATQSVNDIVLGSDNIYYEAQDDGIIGDNPVGSITGKWAVSSFQDSRKTDTLTTLRALTVPQDIIFVTGHTSANDGAFGSLQWVWNSASTTTDNDMTIIKLTSITTGRYELQFSGATNPKWAGAKGDGSTDDVTAIQKVLDNSFIIDGQGLTYRVDSQLDISSNTKFINATLDFSNVATSDTLLDMAGTEDTAINLTSDIAEGDVIVLVAAGGESGFTEGDYIKIGSDAVYDSTQTSSKIGEINQVRTIASGSITLTMPVQQSYATANTARISKLNQISNVVIDNVKCIGGAADDNDQVGVSALYGRNIKITNCEFSKFDSRMGTFIDTILSEVSNNTFRNAHSASTGYGFAFTDATQDCIASENIFQDVRHSLSTNNQSATLGIPRRIKFISNNITDSAKATGGAGGDAIDTHAASEYIEILNNTINYSSNVGINSECNRVIISGNTIYNTVNHGIFHLNQSDRSGETIITNNKVLKAGGMGIRVNGATTASSTNRAILVSGNQISQVDSAGIYVDSTTQALLNCAILGNNLYDIGGDGIFADGVEGISINGNTIRSQVSEGIRLNSCVNYNVSNNTIVSDGSHYIYILGVGSVDGVVNGNVCIPVTTNTSDGVLLSNDVTYTLVKDNNVRNTGGITLGSGTGNSTSADNIT